MADFEIDGVSYTSKVFDGQRQMKILLRLMPAFTAAAQVVEELNQFAAPPANPDDAAPEPLTLKRLGEVVMPVSRELADLKDKDLDFIVNACLDVTQWQAPNGQWKPVRDMEGIILHTGNDRFIVRLKITWAVIGENFSEMFAGFGLDLKGMMAKAVAK